MNAKTSPITGEAPSLGSFHPSRFLAICLAAAAAGLEPLIGYTRLGNLQARLDRVGAIRAPRAPRRTVPAADAVTAIVGPGLSGRMNGEIPVRLVVNNCWSLLWSRLGRRSRNRGPAHS